jgi:hypothetical protein
LFCQTIKSSQVIESEPKVRKRTASKEKIEKTPKGTRIIRLPITELLYPETVKSPFLFRQWIDGLDQKYKLLFDCDLSQGYQLHDIRYSQKMSLSYRRISIGEEIYTVHPSFIMPYWSGKVADCREGILLYLRGTSLDSIVTCFGENQQKWLDRVNHLGRFSIVGTTVKSPDLLAESLTADEKITFLNGKEVYACVTVGENCILGADLSLTEDEDGLKESYDIFKQESLNISPDYQPKSVNTDGWAATRKAWKGLFNEIILILCFLHSYIKIRSISKKEPLKNELFNQVWEAYNADNKTDFINKIAQIDDWAKENINSLTVLAQVEKMKNKAQLFATSFDCQGKRTSNMVDRAIKPMDKFLSNAQYFHGHLASAQLTIRAFAIGYNFLPFCQKTIKNKKNNICLAELPI